jgi:chemotaxis protein MotB
MENEEIEGPTAPFWMVTFSDMVTLLLTFFVMIVSMSEVEVKKFKEALSYFQGSTSILAEDAVTPSLNQQVISKTQARDQAGRYEELLAYLRENELEDKVQAHLTQKGFHLIIADSVMFRSGEAELIEPSRSILGFIAGLLDDRIEAVVVEGHTDDRPIQTIRFPSNWGLSAARAASVVRFLLSLSDEPDASRYAAIGHGEFHPINTNFTPEGRARNRRVEIFFSWEPWQNEIKQEMVPTQLRQGP